ncbi:AAA family ATPase [Pseudomonas alliivorans]|uniref:AAA family ATPase n=1 Tax=Pseudomonas alliivorans TaxID=2810613 RepID=UPI00211D090F|nr:AAA family ATPase [Pseudomonas alliivorans]MCQ9473389.1 AAA family ATPase [Pseudomonas alliivorans]
MKVTLSNVKSVKNLEFEIPQRGVWVVTGLNGSGKTSLFGALYRLGAQHAFQKYYKNNSSLDQVDSFNDARIQYSIGGVDVVYRYGGQRWRATPRSNAYLLKKFPFKTVDYIEANGSRVEPFPDEVKDLRNHLAKKDVREFMADVLGDSKWQRLCYVNTRRGQGNDAYLIQTVVDGVKTFYSEKNFSLGELCVLKLAKKITAVAPGSLLLIDEVEMALHPLAQVRLLSRVIEAAAEKKLTVLFSTHSATLIKNINHRNLIFLKPDAKGDVHVHPAAYPAQVLGEIAFDEEYGTDFIFYVEDKHAQILLTQMCDKYVDQMAPKKAGRPQYRVVPVGGFVQVIEMLKNGGAIFPDHVIRHAFLDEDVLSESLVEYKKKQNTKALDLFKSVKGRLSYLPVTPELGVIKMVHEAVLNNTATLQILKTAFSGASINFSSIIRSAEYKKYTKINERDRAKDQLSYIVEYINSKTNIDEAQIKKSLFSIFTDFFYDSNSELQALLAPVFK